MASGAILLEIPTGVHKSKNDPKASHVVPKVPTSDSLVCLSRENALRRACVMTYRNQWFQNIILVIILLNTLAMALQYAKIPSDVLNDSFFPLEIVFTTCFTLELIIKVIALGFIAHKDSYLRTPWNVLDLIIVVASLVSVAGVAGSFSVIKLLRVLRPLRTLSRVQGMKVLMGALFGSIPQILDNVLLLLFLNFIFAILGIQLFGGSLNNRCVVSYYDEEYYNMTFPVVPFVQRNMQDQPCGGTVTCDPIPHATVSCLNAEDFPKVESILNYDNIFRALLLVFKVISQDDWPQDMDRLMSAYSPHAWIFYTLCTVFGAFFGTNLFLAVLISAYYRNKNEMMLKAQNAPRGSGISARSARKSTIAVKNVVDAFKFRLSNDNAESQIATSPTNANLNASVRERHRNTSSSRRRRTAELPVTPLPIQEIESQDSRPAWRLRISDFVLHQVSQQFVLFVTVVNITFLAIDHHDMDSKLVSVSEIANLVCGVIFAAEILLKIIGLGPRRTFKSGYNSFDFFLVLITIPDLVSGSGSAFTALRAFRMLRTLKLIKRWPSIQKMLIMVASCLRESVYVSLVIVLLIFIFAILGMEIMEGKLNGRPNFNSLWESSLACFIIISGESWVAVMQRAMKTTGTWAVIYFLSLFTIGNLVLTNVFIAISLDKMDSMLDEMDDENEDGSLFAALSMSKDQGDIIENEQDVNEDVQDPFKCPGLQLSPPKSPSVMMLRRFTRTNNDGSKNLTVCKTAKDLGANFAFDSKNAAFIVDSVVARSPADKAGLKVGMMITEIGSQQIVSEMTLEEVCRCFNDGDQASFYVTVKEADCSFVFAEHVPTRKLNKIFAFTHVQLLGTSLGIFESDNRARVFLSKIIHSTIFEIFILMIIVANMIFLAMEHPGAPQGMRTVLDAGDYVFTIIFAVEMLLKIFVLGFWNPPPLEGSFYPPDVGMPYLRDTWNRVDFFVAIMAVGGLLYPPIGLFRALRTVRLIIRSNEIRTIVEALIRCVPALTRSLVLCGFLVFIFGILGVQFFKGRFYHCSDGRLTTKVDCNGTHIVEVIGPINSTFYEEDVRWIQHDSHFDNLGAAIFSLFDLALGDGWTTPMYDGMDSTQVDHAVRYNSSPHASLFFVSFYVIGNFFAINLIVGTLISEFTKMRSKLGPFSMLTESQREYVRYERLMRANLFKINPPVPTQYIRQLAYRIAEHERFSNFITLCIILNMVVFSVRHQGQSTTYDQLQQISNYIFTAIFVTETVIKLTALYPRNYFSRNWNKFDFTIVVISLISLFLSSFQGASAIRVLRIGRLFRLLNKAKGLQKLFDTLFQDRNLMFFGNIGMLLMSVFFVFGVAGVDLFGKLKRIYPINTNFNFENLPQAMLTLASASTTEGWIDIRTVLVSQGDRAWVPAVYFVLFMVIGCIVMLNVFAAVVVELLQEQETNTMNMSKIDVLRKFIENWEEVFDCRKSVPASDLVKTLEANTTLLPEELAYVPRFIGGEFVPVPLKKELNGLDMITFLASIPVPLSKSCEIHVRSLVFALAAREYDILTADINLLRHLKLTKSPKIIQNCFTLMHWFAADKIRCAFWKRKGRKNKDSENPLRQRNCHLAAENVFNDTSKPCSEVLELQVPTIIKKRANRNSDNSQEQNIIVDDSNQPGQHKYIEDKSDVPEELKSSEKASHHRFDPPPDEAKQASYNFFDISSTASNDKDNNISNSVEDSLMSDSDSTFESSTSNNQHRVRENSEDWPELRPPADG